MAQLFVYHMKGLTKTWPGGKKVLENVHLSFYPTPRSACSASTLGQIDAAAHHGGHRHGIHGKASSPKARASAICRRSRISIPILACAAM